MVYKSKGALKATEEAEPKTRSRTRSPARNKSPARVKSPTKNKSPTRAKSKSPARNPKKESKEVASPPLKASTPKAGAPKARSPIRKSPSRKSPPRVVKTTVSKSADTFFSERVQRPRRTQVDIDTDSDNPDGEVKVHEKPQATVRGRARRLEVHVEKMKIDTDPTPSAFNLIKRVTRNSQNREVERVVHLKHFEAKKMGEFSDEDESVLRKSVSVERGQEFKQVTEFGGVWGALFYMLITPITVMGLYAMCNELQCSFFNVPDITKYFYLETYLDLSSILGFFGYAIILAILSVIPFGGKQITGMATKQGKFTYIMNGLFSCFVLIAIGVGLEVRKIAIGGYIVKHLFHLLIASIIFGFLLTCFAFVRSFYVPFSALNAHVVGRNKIYGFFMGRELNPHVFGLLDLKMYVFRLALIGCVLVDLSFFYNSLNVSSKTFDLKSLNINPTLVILTLIHLIYYLDALAHETVFVTSFEIQYEGFGYMSGVGYLIYPFMMASVTKYVIDYNINLPIWQLLWVILMFVIGYILFRGGNNQKDAFRKNPYDPSLSHLETIPTTKGKKLICSGFWGIVRHPNYLGDICMNLAFIPFAARVPPVLSSICIILFLIHRSVRDNIRCKQKYGAAWDRYCSKVKYVLLPKIY